MNKKIVVILSFFIVIAGMSAVAAFDFNDLSNSLLGAQKETVAIDGINFTIPDGFSEVENESLDSQVLDNPYIDVNISSKAYANASGEVMILSVSSSNVTANTTFAEDAAGVDGNKTTINGIEGYTSVDDEFNSFSYAKDGKLVIVSSTDKELIDDFVVA
jgi:hypothetical protein